MASGEGWRLFDDLLAALVGRGRAGLWVVGLLLGPWLAWLPSLGLAPAVGVAPSAVVAAALGFVGAACVPLRPRVRQTLGAAFLLAAAVRVGPALSLLLGAALLASVSAGFAFRRAAPGLALRLVLVSGAATAALVPTAASELGRAWTGGVWVVAVACAFHAAVREETPGRLLLVQALVLGAASGVALALPSLRGVWGTVGVLAPVWLAAALLALAARAPASLTVVPADHARFVDFQGRSGRRAVESHGR